MILPSATAVILSLRDSDILRRCRKVILYSPLNCAKRNITRRKPNITATQYNSPKANITEKTAFRRFFSNGYEKDGFAFLTDGFELAEVLSDIAVCDGSDIVPSGQ